MNCITWNHDWYSFWNFDSFDDAGVVAVSLESKKKQCVLVRQGTMEGVLNIIDMIGLLTHFGPLTMT